MGSWCGFGFLALCLFGGFAGGLKGAEFFHLAFAAADETVFLKVEIAEIFLQVDAGLHFEEGRRVIGESGFCFDELAPGEIEKS